VVVLTSDNPRSEDPAAIIDQVRAGIGAGVDLVVDPDRGHAIVAAVGLARAGDVVVLAGKGHETTQTVGGQLLPFDDRAEARRALDGRFGGGVR
jgi:UDP-N-acetylmuramyl tripeptide synthase